MAFKDLCSRCTVGGGHKPCHYRNQLAQRGTCSRFVDKFATPKEAPRKPKEKEEYFKIWQTDWRDLKK